MRTPGLKCLLILLPLVVLLFFVQVPSGGFQATHGPHSTLKEGAAQRYMKALIIFLAQICAALLSLAFSMTWEVSQLDTAFSSVIPGNCTAPLRC